MIETIVGLVMLAGFVVTVIIVAKTVGQREADCQQYKNIKLWSSQFPEVAELAKNYLAVNGKFTNGQYEKISYLNQFLIHERNEVKCEKDKNIAVQEILKMPVASRKES